MYVKRLEPGKSESPGNVGDADHDDDSDRGR